MSLIEEAVKVTDENPADLMNKTCRDRISGFEGVVRSVTYSCCGAVRVCLEAKAGPGGAISDEWIELDRLDFVES
jgi:hypothetical protein